MKLTTIATLLYVFTVFCLKPFFMCCVC